MTKATPNYRETHFQHKDLTKISGPVNWQNLYDVILELKTNAQTVRSDLGGGQYGYLALVIDPQAYLALTNQVGFVRPVHPGPFTFPAGATRHAIDALKEEHVENLRVFNECEDVERAMRQQLIEAVHPSYTKPLRNHSTGAYRGSLFNMIEYLRNTFGRMSKADLEQFDTDTKTMTVDPSLPIDVVFSRIDELEEHARITGTPYTDNQIVQIAYNLVNKATVFGEYLRMWNRRIPGVQTWFEFKILFREAQTELRETGDLTLADAGYHQANMVDEIIDRMREIVPTTTTTDTQIDAQLSQLANAAISNANASSNTMPALVQQMQQMQTTMLQMQQQMQQGGGGGGGDARNSNNGRRAPAGPRLGQPTRPLPASSNLYCWTHGRCAHTGGDCENRAPGHKVEATQANKMEGSKWGCL